MERPESPRGKTLAVPAAIAFAALLVGGFWLVVGGYPSLVMAPQEKTPIAQQLASPATVRRTYDPALPLDHVSYQHHALKPVGQLERYPVDQMVFVGQSDEGYSLWSHQPPGGTLPHVGGGGGPTSPRAVPQAPEQVFLRAPDGRYRLLIQAGR